MVQSGRGFMGRISPLVLRDDDHVPEAFGAVKRKPQFSAKFTLLRILGTQGVYSRRFCVINPCVKNIAAIAIRHADQA